MAEAITLPGQSGTLKQTSQPELPATSKTQTAIVAFDSIKHLITTRPLRRPERRRLGK